MTPPETTSKVRYEWDNTTIGLGVRFNKNGTKSYVFKCRGRGKVYQLTIGPTDAISSLRAREIAARMRALAKHGSDPIIAFDGFKPGHGIEQLVKELKGYRDAKSVTLGEFAFIYLERHAKRWKKSWKHDQQLFSFMKTLNERALISIRREDIERLHWKLTKRAPVSANKTIQLLRVIFRYAIEWGYLPEGHQNPASKIKMNKVQSRDNALTPKERQRLEAVLNAHPELKIKTAIRMFLNMGYRHQEVLKLKWDYITPDLDTIRLPDTKNGKPHIMPVPEILIPALRELKEQSNGIYVFPGKYKNTKFHCLDKQWRKIRVEAGIPKTRIHDLRHTFATDLLNNGVDLYTISRLMNHGVGYITSIYAKHRIEPLREILNTNASLIAGIRPSMKVVSLQDWKEQQNGR